MPEFKNHKKQNLIFSKRINFLFFKIIHQNTREILLYENKNYNHEQRE